MGHINVFVSAICHDGNGKFLMGKRGGQARDRHGEWEFGGGAVDPGETAEAALRRETREEFGVEICDVTKVGFSEFERPSGHWLGLFYLAKVDPTAVRIAEPVYDEIGWFTPDALPEPMFEDAKVFAEQVAKML